MPRIANESLQKQYENDLFASREARERYFEAKREYDRLSAEINENDENAIARLEDLGCLVNKIDGTLYCEWKQYGFVVRRHRNNINSKIRKKINNRVKEKCEENRRNN